MKMLPRLSVVAFMATSAYVHGATPWTYQVNSEGARILELSGQISTPSGMKNAQIKFVRSTGPKIAWSFDLVIAGVSSISGFTFDDFEGPDSRAEGDLLRLETVGLSKPSHFAFCPAGGYVSTPKDGFTLGAYRTGKANPLLNLIKSASHGKGRLVLSLRDYKNPSVLITGAFDLAGSEALFAQFLSGV